MIREGQEIKQTQDNLSHSQERIEAAPDPEANAQEKIRGIESRGENLKEEQSSRFEDITSKSKLSQADFDKIKDSLKVLQRLKEITDRGETTSSGAKEKIRRIMTSEKLSAILDVVPFISGIKGITESVKGKEMTGNGLSKKERIKKGVLAAGDLALDLVAAGEAIKVAKAGVKGVKGIKIGAKYVGKEIASGFARGAREQINKS